MSTTAKNNESAAVLANPPVVPPPLVVQTTSTTTTTSGGLGSGLKSFISGGVGGICVVLVGHPLDLIKVRMQTSGQTGGSVFGLLRQTFVQSGVRGLYRGVSAPLTAVTPIFALSFWGYDMGQRLITYGTGHEQLTMVEKCLAGGLSGIPTTLIMAPSERIKVLMQTGTKYTSMYQCGYQLFREGGLSSLFRGTTLTLVRDVPGSMAWFGTYELVKQTLTSLQGYKDPSQLSPLAVLTAGGFAGMACWTVSIPADVLKSRLQSAPEGQYRGSYDVLRQLLQTEGPTALFTGIRPALIRAFPANAACFFGMELSKKSLSYVDEWLMSSSS